MLFPIPILYFTAYTHTQNVATVILVSQARNQYGERHDLVNCREVHRGWNILPAGTEFLRRIHVYSCVSGSLSVETRPRGCAAEVVVVVIRFGKHWGLTRTEPVAIAARTLTLGHGDAPRFVSRTRMVQRGGSLRSG